MRLIYLNLWDNLDLGKYRILLFLRNNIYPGSSEGVLFILRNIFLTESQSRLYLFFRFLTIAITKSF
jgi:hypothetical protein